MEPQSPSTDELQTEAQETIIRLEETIRSTVNVHTLTNRFLHRRGRKPKKSLVQVSCHIYITDLLYYNHMQYIVKGADPGGSKRSHLFGRALILLDELLTCFS